MPGDNDVHKAAAKGETEKIRGLLDLTQYDDPPLSVNDLGASDRRPLHRAAGGGFLECSQFLLEAGAEIDAVRFL